MLRERQRANPAPGSGAEVAAGIERTAPRCEVCTSALRRGAADWHFVCDRCGLEQSTFAPAINAMGSIVKPDERVRAEGLAPLREEAYRRLLGELRSVRGRSGGTLLEVGSAHGWFLRAARPQFDRVVGIEPDDGVRRADASPGSEVRAGYFPDAVAAGETFDVIAFNDVFEHIPGARRVARAIAEALAPGGIAVVALPMREGALYRIARALHAIGVRGPFERMWQRGFPSPHLYYFSRQALARVFAEAGCVIDRSIPMPTIALRGLWSRIRYAEPVVAAAAVQFIAALLAAPFLALLPADVRCFYLLKVPGAGPEAPRAPSQSGER